MKAQNNVSIWDAFGLSVAFPPRSGPKPDSSGSLQGHCEKTSTGLNKLHGKCDYEMEML